MRSDGYSFFDISDRFLSSDHRSHPRFRLRSLSAISWWARAIVPGRPRVPARKQTTGAHFHYYEDMWILNPHLGLWRCQLDALCDCVRWNALTHRHILIHNDSVLNETLRLYPPVSRGEGKGHKRLNLNIRLGYIRSETSGRGYYLRDHQSQRWKYQCSDPQE